MTTKISKNEMGGEEEEEKSEECGLNWHLPFL